MIRTPRKQSLITNCWKRGNSTPVRDAPQHQLQLKARAHPDQTFRGTVTAIATVAQINSSSSSGSIFSSAGQTPSGTATFSRANVNPKTVLVTTRIDNSALLLKPEMTGQAKILCGQKRIVDLMTRRLARTLKVEFWWWW